MTPVRTGVWQEPVSLGASYIGHHVGGQCEQILTWPGHHSLGWAPSSTSTGQVQLMLNPSREQGCEIELPEDTPVDSSVFWTVAGHPLAP